MALKLRVNLLLALLMTALPILAVLVVSTVLWSNSEWRSAEERGLATARLLNASMEAIIEESQRSLESIAQDPTINWDDRQGTLRRLDSYADRYPFAHGISWFTPQGVRVATPGSRAEGISVADRPWFQKTLENRHFTLGAFVLSRLSGAPSLPMALVVERHQKVVAVLGMSVDLAWFYAHIERQFRLAEITITLIDPDGTVLVRYPSMGQYTGRPFMEPSLLPAVLAGSSVSAQFVGFDGVKRLYSLEPLRLDRGIVAVLAIGIPVVTIHGGTQLAQTLTWGGVLGAVVLAFLILVFGVRAVVLRPVSRIADHTAQLAGGQFSLRIERTRLPEELEVLALAINSMAASLEQRDGELATYRNHLEDMVNERTAELEASRAELARSNADLQQFAYVASHDLQEPLRMVASFTQLLERKFGDRLDDQGRQYIQYAVDGATRMQQLINDLLTYSRAESQGRDFVAMDGREPVDLALRNLEILLQERHAKVEVGELPRVTGDRGQLTQVFQNLMANGVKFNRSEQPLITVSAQKKRGFVEFVVQDNGIGIDPEFRERIFVIFQRLHPRGEFSGTGIGLALCKRIVERHGGKIWLEPQPSGSQFRFTVKD